MEDLLRQLPNARPAGTVRPTRISLDSLKGFLDAVPDLSREQAQTRPAAAPSPTPSADANWMEDCGLVAAAARHKARREAKERYMLEVVDIGRAFPPSPHTASSVETSTTATPFQSPYPNARSTTRDPHHPIFLTPATTSGGSAAATPPTNLPSPFTRENSFKGSDKSSSSDSPARVSQKAFVRLMGYNTKSTAALQSQMRAKWWSSRLETPSHSSTSMPVRADACARTPLFYSSGGDISQLCILPTHTQAPLLPPDQTDQQRSSSVPPRRPPLSEVKQTPKQDEVMIEAAASPPPSQLSKLKLSPKKRRSPLSGGREDDEKATPATTREFSSLWSSSARHKATPENAAAAAAAAAAAFSTTASRRPSSLGIHNSSSSPWSRESRLGGAPSASSSSSSSSAEQPAAPSYTVSSSSSSRIKTSRCSSEFSLGQRLNEKLVSAAARRAAWSRTAGAPTPPRMRRRG